MKFKTVIATLLGASLIGTNALEVRVDRTAKKTEDSCAGEFAGKFELTYAKDGSGDIATRCIDDQKCVFEKSVSECLPLLRSPGDGARGFVIHALLNIDGSQFEDDGHQTILDNGKGFKIIATPSTDFELSGEVHSFRIGVQIGGEVIKTFRTCWTHDGLFSFWVRRADLTKPEYLSIEVYREGQLLGAEQVKVDAAQANIALQTQSLWTIGCDYRGENCVIPGPSLLEKNTKAMPVDAVSWMRWAFVGEDVLDLTASQAASKSFSRTMYKTLGRAHPICGSAIVEAEAGEQCDWAAPWLSDEGELTEYTEFTHPRCGCTCAPKCPQFTAWASSVKLHENFQASVNTAKSTAGTSFGDWRHIQCEDGYSSDADNLGEIVQCTKEGAWTDPAIECKLNCQGLPSFGGQYMILSDSASNTDTDQYYHHTEMRVACAPNHAPAKGMPATEALVTCQDGKWSTAALKCYPTCGEFPDLGTKQYTTTGHGNGEMLGATRSVTCATGFSSTTGVAKQDLRCELNGKWSPLLVDCQANCAAPGAPKAPFTVTETSLGGVNTLSAVTKAGEWYRVGCASGFTPSTASGSELVYCLGGSWTAITMGCSLTCPSETEFLSSTGLAKGVYDVKFGGSKHGDVSVVSCAVGYSTAPTGVSVDTNGNETFKRGVSDQVRCLNGAYETPKIECYQECPAYTPPSQFYEVIGGPSTGNGHGSYRSVQCRKGFETISAYKEGGMREDVSYCVDGQWSTVSLACAPGCSTNTLNSYFCDINDKKDTCQSRFDMRWSGIIKDQTPAKDWPTSVPAGTEFEVQCNDAKGLTTQDGTRNKWRTIRCLGSTSTALEVQWSLIGLSCGSRCDLNLIDFGTAYDVNIKLPGVIGDTYGNGMSFRDVLTSVARVETFEAQNLNFLQVEQDFLNVAAVDDIDVADDDHPANIALVQLGSSTHSAAWLGRATSKSRADYLSKVSQITHRNLAVAAPSGDSDSMAAFHNLQGYEPLSRKADAFQYPANKAMFTVARLHAKRVEAYKAAGLAVPTALIQLSTAASNARTVAPTHHHNAAKVESEALLAWPRIPLAMPPASKVAHLGQHGAQLVQSNNGGSFIQLSQSTTANGTNSTAEVEVDEYPCEDADDLFEVLLSDYSYTSCARAVEEKETICGYSAKQLLKSVSGSIPPLWTLDPETDVGLICARSCKLCLGRDAYAAASMEKDITNMIDSMGRCLNRESTVAGIAPGWTCADVVSLRGLDSCSRTIKDAFTNAGVDPTQVGLTDASLASPFSHMCPVTCGTCPDAAALKEAIKEELIKREQELKDAQQALRDELNKPATPGKWSGYLMPHGSKARLSCAYGYTDASVYEASLQIEDTSATTSIDGDGVAVAIHSDDTKKATKIEGEETLTCSLGAWSPRTLQCASHCDEYALPKTYTENYSITGYGTQHGSMRVLSCAANAAGTLGFSSQEIYCLDGRWTARTLECRLGCDRTLLPALKLSMAQDLSKDGIDKNSLESRRYSHAASWMYQCTPSKADRAAALAAGKDLLKSEIYNAVEDAGGFVKDNGQTVTCNNGQWSQLVLMCKRDCGEAPLPDTNRHTYTAHKRLLDEWKFPATEAPKHYGASLIQRASNTTLINPEQAAISTRHGDYLEITCAVGYSHTAGPDSGVEKLKCLDGQWQPQTLVCKKDCREYSPNTDELQSSRYMVVSPDGTPQYPSVIDGVKHGMSRILRCNSLEDNYPVTAASEGRVTCQDGVFTTPLVQCRRTCMALKPAMYATGQLFTHYPPWGYCIWDPYLEKCVDVEPGYTPPHNTRVWLNCAPGFAPVSGVAPTEVQCNDGVYTTIWLTCAPECQRDRLNIPVGMKILTTAAGVSEVQSPSVFDDYKSLPGSSAQTVFANSNKYALGEENFVTIDLPEGVTEDLALRLSSLSNPSSAKSVNGTNAALNPGGSAANSALIQMHQRHKLLSSTGARAITSTYYHGMDLSDARFSSNDLADTTQVDIEGMTNFDREFSSLFENQQEADTSYYSAAILQAMASRGEIDLADVDVSNVPVAHSSAVTFGCEDWAAPVPGTEVGSTVSCFWGSWTIRALQCKGRCTGDAPRQMLSQYEKSDAYTLISTEESFMPGGQITIECVEGVSDPWPTRYGGGRAETATCVDGAFSTLTMSCMHRCPVHPLEGAERYVLEAETTYGSAGIYQHGSVMRISCAEGYTASFAAGNETSTCVDSQWSATAIQCFKDCPVLPNPGEEYWVGPMQDRLKAGWAGDNTQTFQHGEDLWVSCSPGFYPGLGAASKKAKACNKIMNPGCVDAPIQLNYNNVTTACNDGAFTKHDLLCYEGCPHPDTMFWDSHKYIFKRLSAAGVEGDVNVHDTQYQISCNTADGYFHTGEQVHFKETVTCKDGSYGEPAIKCRKACPIFGTSPNTIGLTTSYGYNVKAARPSPFWTPGIVEKLQGPNQVMKDTLYHLHGAFRVINCQDNYSPARRNAEGTVTPWEGDLLPIFADGTVSVVTTVNEFVVTGDYAQTHASVDVSRKSGVRTAYGTEVTLNTGEDALVCDDGEWKGRSLVCLKKCTEFVHPYNLNQNNAQRYNVFKLIDEGFAGFDDNVEAEMTMDLVSVPQNKQMQKLKVVQGSRRVVSCKEGFWPQSTGHLHTRYDGVPSAVVECKDGFWSNAPITCMRMCPEPYNNQLYKMCKEYHMDAPSSACSNDNWMAYFATKKDCAAAVCSAPPHNNVANGAHATSGNSTESAGGNTVGAVGESDANTVLMQAAINWKFWEKEQSDPEAAAAVRNGELPASGEEGEEEERAFSNLSPYKIFQSIITADRWNFPDLDSNSTIANPAHLSWKATKPGDTHVVMCNAQAGFGPVYRDADDSLFSSDYTSIAIVTCVDGVWSDLPFRCDKGCLGGYDLYARWERWLPVFTDDNAYARCEEDRLTFNMHGMAVGQNMTSSASRSSAHAAQVSENAEAKAAQDAQVAAMVTDMIENNTKYYYDKGENGLNLWVSEPGGPLHKDNPFGKFLKERDLMGRADGLFCEAFLRTESTRVPKTILIRDSDEMKASFLIRGAVTGKTPYKWPMGLHWAIWGPGCCDPANCWLPSTDACKKRIYGRGTWVAYETLDYNRKGIRQEKRQVFYARCNSGGMAMTPTVQFMGEIKSSALVNVEPVIHYKPNPDTSASIRSYSWSTPELPLRWGNKKTEIMWPLQRVKKVRGTLNKPVELTCTEIDQNMIKIGAVRYRSAMIKGDFVAQAAVEALCNGNVNCMFRVLNTNLGLPATFAACPKGWSNNGNWSFAEPFGEVNNIAVDYTVGHTVTGDNLTFAQLTSKVSRTGKAADASDEMFTDMGADSNVTLSESRRARLEKNSAHVKAMLKANNYNGEGILFNSNKKASNLNQDVAQEATSFIQTDARRRLTSQEASEQLEQTISDEANEDNLGIMQKGARAVADILRAVSGRPSSTSAGLDASPLSVEKKAAELDILQDVTPEQLASTLAAHDRFMAALEETFENVEAVPLEQLPTHVLENGLLLNPHGDFEIFASNYAQYEKDLIEGRVQVTGADYSFLQTFAKAHLAPVLNADKDEGTNSAFIFGFFESSSEDLPSAQTMQQLTEGKINKKVIDTGALKAKWNEMSSQVAAGVMGMVAPTCAALTIEIDYYCMPAEGFGQDITGLELEASMMKNEEQAILKENSFYVKLDNGEIEAPTKTAADRLNKEKMELEDSPDA